MEATQTNMSKALLWGSITAALYWSLFHFAGDFQTLAHTTLDACAIQDAGQVGYFNKTTPELCSAKGGEFIQGNWTHVFAPILLAFALSYTHGNFTSLFWDLVGLKAAPNKKK